MAQVVCGNCGAVFDKPDRYVRRSANHFCSRSCAATANNRIAVKRERLPKLRVCEYCGALYELRVRGARAAAQKYCSRRCGRRATTVSPRIPDDWKRSGTFLDRSKGYVLAYAPKHPRATNRGYVYEHRLVMEEQLGRPLRSDEHVHHRNGCRWDNRPENLEVMDAAEHARLGGQRPEDLTI